MSERRTWLGRRDFIELGAALSGAFIIGCDSGGGPGSPDGGAHDSGHAGGTDAGTTASDAGMPGTDGGTSTDGGSSAGCSGDFIDADISQNHTSDRGPHALRVPVADIVAGVEKTYQTMDVPGADPQDHCHLITVTSADFATLRAGGTVRVYGCSQFTSHEFALSCAAPPTAGDPDPACVGVTPPECAL